MEDPVLQNEDKDPHDLNDSLVMELVIDYFKIRCWMLCESIGPYVVCFLLSGMVLYSVYTLFKQQVI